MGQGDIAAVFEADHALIQPLLAQASAELTKDEADAAKELQCGTPQAEAGCQLRVHYLFQALRALPPRMVFRSLISAFMLADHDPRFVGINIVMPEDHPLALRDYRLHMAMIRFLAARYPKVKRTLHAGELGATQVARPTAPTTSHRPLTPGRSASGTALTSRARKMLKPPWRAWPAKALRSKST
jgi:adenosine deaminase